MILVEPLHQKLQLFVTHEVPKGCHRPSQLIARQVAITIPITALKGLMHSKLRPPTQSLPKHLSLLLGLEMGAEGLDVEVTGLWGEKVRPAVAVLSVESGSALDLAGHIMVIGGESVAELRVEKSIVAISIKAAHKEIYFILVRE